MIKRFIFFIILSALFFSNLAFSQTQPNVNPINVAIKIVEEVDTVRMIETCQYYNLTKTDPEDGFIVFMASDGTKLRFKMTSDSPIVEVVTKQKPKQIRSYLRDMGFSQTDKTSNDMNDFTRHITISDNPTTLSIQRLKCKKYDR